MSRVPYLDELGAELERAARVSTVPTRSRWRGVVAATSAFVLVLVVGAVIWLIRQPSEVAEPTETTTSTTMPDAGALPLTWARLDQASVYASETSFTLNRVIHGSLGFLAIGDEPGAGEARDGLVLASDDGLAWTRVDDDASLDGLNLTAIADAGESLAVAAFDTEVAFLTSTDGATWNRATVEASDGLAGRIATAVAPLGVGYVAVGNGLAEGGSETGLLWFTEDGRTWREVSDPAFAAASLSDVVVAEEAIHIAGMSAIAEGTSEPAIWTSQDSGSTWATVLLPRIEDSGFAGVTGIAARDGRWVAVGFESNSGAVWTSDDGLDWHRVTPSGDQFSRERIPTRMYDVVMAPQGIVVAGGEFLGEEARRVTWVSEDGAGWSRLDFDDPASIEDAALFAYSLATDDTTIVAVGAEMAPDGPAVGAVFVSPPGPGLEALAAETPTPPSTGDDLPSVSNDDGRVRIGMDSSLAEGRVYVEGTQVDTSVNPLLFWDAHDVARFVVPGAYRMDPGTGELTPWLVERIPRLGDGLEISDDGTVTVTYTVRDDAVWEDGTPVMGDDLAFTHELIMRYADRIVIDVRAHDLIDPGSITVDGRTMTFELTTPDVTYERLFEWILPAHVIDPDTFLDDWNDQLWPSAGPFRFVSFEIPTSRLTEPSVVLLERNPNYWEADPITGEALPHLDGIELHLFPGGAEEGSVAGSVVEGDLDAVIGRFASRWALRWYGNLDEHGLELRTRAHPLYELLIVNLDEGRLVANPNSRNRNLAYRQAVLSAIDRERLGDDLALPPVSSIVGVASSASDHDAWAPYNDTGRVSDLLKEVEEPIEAVYASSFADSTIAIGEAVAQQLGDAGIATTTQFDGDFFGTLLPDRQLDLYAVRLFASGVGPASTVETMTFLAPGEGLIDWTGLDAEGDRYADLLRRARTEFDPDRYIELLQEAESILADNALVYPLVLRQSSNAIVRPDRIEGIMPNRTTSWDTWNAAWWRPGG